MAWMYTCAYCNYRVIAKTKGEAEKFYCIHFFKSHSLDFDDTKGPIITRISNEDYEVIKSLPSFPAFII